MRKLLAASLALAAAVACPACAAEITETHQVSLGDLDLTRVADRAALRHRLALAAQQVCGTPDVEGLYDSDAFLGCYTDAIRRAQAEADARMAEAVDRASVASIR